MAGVARVSVRRNNNPTPRLTRRQPTSTTAGAPFGLSTFYLDSVGDVDTYSLPPIVLHDKYGPSPFTSTAGGKKMLKQGKQPLFGDLGYDDDDESDEEADGEGFGLLSSQQSKVKQDGEALYFRMDMPGVGKEDTKVYLEGSTLVAKGTRKSDPHFEDAKSDARKKGSASAAKTYSAGVGLVPMHKYKVDEVKVELKNGVLKIKVPKVKDEERTDVHYFQIDG